MNFMSAFDFSLVFDYPNGHVQVVKIPIGSGGQTELHLEKNLSKSSPEYQLEVHSNGQVHSVGVDLSIPGVGLPEFHYLRMGYTKSTT